MSEDRLVGSSPGPDHDLLRIPMSEVETRLATSSKGLTAEEAARRLLTFGPNEMPVKRVNLFLQLLKYFVGPIPWMIEAAIILSAILGHWPDFAVILTLLFANAGIGFWQERQAGRAIDALKAQLALGARVLRDGQWSYPSARELVPGDVIRLRRGDIVPADARLLDGDSIEVDQSALTGESLPAVCAPGAVVYSSSIVRQGEIGALVVATGAHTYFSKTAELVQDSQPVSHFHRAVMKIGTYLILLAIAMVSLIVVVSSVRGDPFMATLQFALVLTVAAIPVAMPTVLSVTMAVGARLLAAKQAIVSRLVAIEELAGVDVLCTDKTGTLTQNALTLGTPYVAQGHSAHEVIECAALASRVEDQDPIDLAVISALEGDDSLRGYRVEHFQPFDAVSKRTEASVRSASGAVLRVTKGAPQVILGLSAPAPEVASEARRAVREFAQRGFRSLAVARADGEGPVGWQLVGVVPMFDPPRADAHQTIATALSMGVKVKMVTGDSLAIAVETARSLDMGTAIFDAATLGDSTGVDSSSAVEAIEAADGYAQVFPEHKYHIVEVLQRRGHIVGMTGDGVNDAPALKQADCGIAVSNATDAARAAASIVLITPGLSVIIDAIKESRQIFQRMTSYAIYRIAETLRVLLFISLVILVFNFFPVTAIQIVLLALLNDGAILSIAYDNVRYRNRPEAWNMRVVLGMATILGVVGPIASFGLFLLGDRVLHLGRPEMQTMMYLSMSVAGHLTIFQARTRGPFWSIRPARVLWLAVLGTQVIATVIAVSGLFMTRLPWSDAALVWGYAVLWFAVTDRVKLAGYRYFDRVGSSSDGADVQDSINRVRAT